METVVAKFGGTSLADVEKINLAAEKVAALFRHTHNIAVVVSAPAKLTDELLALRNKISQSPNPRETAQLLSSGEVISASLFAFALANKKIPAISLTAQQAQIKGSGKYLDSYLRSISAAKIKTLFHKKIIPVIAGFQSVNRKGEIEILGRGGSDFTAVALAKFLGADECQFYTDIEGIYTANPTLVPLAKKISFMGYQSLIEYCKTGHMPRQLKAVEYAARHTVPLHIRSTFINKTGTIVGRSKAKKFFPVCITYAKTGNKAKILLICDNLKNYKMPNLSDLRRKTAKGIPITNIFRHERKLEFETSLNHCGALLCALHNYFFTQET